MATGYYEYMSCQTCQWFRRPEIIQCEKRLAAGPGSEVTFNPVMGLICVSPRDKKTGKCSVLKME
jgi:hypothetical protein